MPRHDVDDSSPPHHVTNNNKARSFRSELCLGLFTMFLVEGYSETVLFRYLSNHVFQTLQFRKYISYDCHLYFEYVQNFI